MKNQHLRTFPCYVFVLFVLLLGSSGCSDGDDFQFGLYTKMVQGSIKAEGVSAQNKIFILVLDYHRTFLETSEGNLQRVSSFLVYPDERGFYTVPLTTDSTQVDLKVYSAGMVVASHRFQRTLGIGSYYHNFDLKKDDNWQNSFYLMIKPSLVEFITEKRFLMSDQNKLFIGDWLSAAEEGF